MTADAARELRIYLEVDAGGWDPALEARPDVVVLDMSRGGDEVAADFGGLGSRVGPPLVFAAIPALASGRADAALDRLMPLAPDGIVLRGCVGSRDVEHLSAKLAVREAEWDRPDGSIWILAMAADSAAGVLALPTFAGRRHPRLAGLGSDPNRLRAEIRCRDDAPALRAASATLVLAAAAIGTAAVALPGRTADEPWLRFDGLRAQGYRAVLLREAGEVEVAREVFGPE
ncbi:hypothetical protein [uncultured Enterovirga sp.]|uniref:hypothetical protein n=1 Tax=uncultured Enterovirga sp. TaxID=2026352 RepID=UPI0035CC2393